jgi:hypothetical protein
MGYLSRAKTWTREILYASDLNAEFDNIIGALTDADTDVAVSQLGVGTTALYFAANMSTATLARVLNITQTKGGAGPNYGIYNTVSGASTDNMGAYFNVSGGTDSNTGARIDVTGAAGAAVGYGLSVVVTGAAAFNAAGIFNCTGGTINYAIYCSSDTSHVRLPYVTAAPVAAVDNGSIVVGFVAATPCIYVRANGAWSQIT